MYINDTSDMPCCPGVEIGASVTVTRVVYKDGNTVDQKSFVRSYRKLTPQTVAYKALSKRNGNARRDTQRVSIESGIQVKARVASTLRSLLIPGDTDPLKSPIRSAVSRILTPGKPSISGSFPTKPNRGYRCPEGYQYGGRFTDSRLSTCGLKLFDIPSPLGLLISAIRRAGRNAVGANTYGKPLTPGTPIVDPVTRKPQIPRVSLDNGRAVDISIKEMARQMRSHNGTAVRLVRRDGFVLEPVVSAKVLRAIPDSRDMENGTYLLNVMNPEEIGGEELGLLSNTGIKSLRYITPNGSIFTLEKVRLLEIGERRKLGRTVNSSMTIDNSKDPLARLKAVASETGNGLRFSEDLIGTVSEIFKRRKGGKIAAPEDVDADKDVAKTDRTKLIDSIGAAIAHIADGGSLADISPEILAELLSKNQSIRTQKLSRHEALSVAGTSRYLLHTSPGEMDYIDEMYSAAVQRHLGLNAPRIIPVGKADGRREYFREDVETALAGSKFNPDATFQSLLPNDVASMMIADMLTDQIDRPLTSVYAMEMDGATRPMLANNTVSQLTDLSKIEITKRSEMSIDRLYRLTGMTKYSEYYGNLSRDQQRAYMLIIASLLEAARKWNSAKYARSLDKYALNDNERHALAIRKTIFDGRLSTLMGGKRRLAELFRGES